MSIGYQIRRILLELRQRRAREAADYCRAQRRLAERSVAHHEAEERRLAIALAQMEHRAHLARLGGA